LPRARKKKNLTLRLSDRVSARFPGRTQSHNRFFIAFVMTETDAC